MPALILLLGLCGIAACMFYGRREEVVMVQQPYGQQVMGPNGQVMVVQQGGYYDPYCASILLQTQGWGRRCCLSPCLRYGPMQPCAHPHLP